MKIRYSLWSSAATEIYIDQYVYMNETQIVCHYQSLCLELMYETFEYMYYSNKHKHLKNWSQAHKD